MEERNTLFPPILPSLVRFCKAFPPIIEDVVSLLAQYGRITVSEHCFKGYSSPRNFDMTVQMPVSFKNMELKEEVLDVLQKMPEDDSLAGKIQRTFAEIVQNSLLEKKVF